MIKNFILTLVVFSAAAHATDSSENRKLRWRPGYTYLSLSSDSSEVSLSGLNDVSALVLDEGPIAGSGAEVQGDGRPSIVLTYALNDRWSIETIVAPPFDFALDFTGTIRDESIAPTALGSVPTNIRPFGQTLGSVKALPAVVTATYKLKPHGRWQPYVGVGFTYVYSFDPEIENEVLLESGSPTLKVGSAFGLILQTGINIAINDDFKLHLDVKHGSGIDLSGEINDISLNSPALGDLFGLATAERGSLDLSLEALVLNASVSWNF